MITSQAINKLLRAEDLEGMIEAGAPGDEYVPEANRIAAAVNALSATQATEENIVAIVALAWMQDFHLDESAMRDRAQGIRRVAQQIFIHLTH